MSIKKGSKNWNEDYVKGVEFPLNNVKVIWADIMADSPDTKYEACWKLDAVLEKGMAKSMEAAGFGVKEKDGEFTLTIKKKCRTKAGKEQAPPSVVGRDGRTPFTEDVGNGSVCNVIVFAKYNEVKGITYLTPYLNGVQVVDHVSRGSGFGNVDADPLEKTDDIPF